MASSAASASRGASQPAEEDRYTPQGAAPRAAPQRGSFTVASFNFGFEQNMMLGKRAKTHCANFGRVTARIVDDAAADIFFGCEVGAHRQGLRKAGIFAKDILTKLFGDGIGFSEVDNYVSLWGFGGAPQPAVVSLHGDTEIYRVPVGQDVDAVVARFDVQTSEGDEVHLVTGNMHIVCGRNRPSIVTRQRAVRMLRRHLDVLKAPEAQTPVVRLVVGDNNITSEEARHAFQRHTDDEPSWKVFAAPADGKGDNVAVCGADAYFRTVAVGASYSDRGMRNDARDAVAVVLTLPGASQPAVL